MLRERQVGIVFELAWQPPLEQGPLPGRRTGYGDRLHVSALPPELEPTLDGGHGDPDELGHLLAGHPAVNRIQHLQSQIFRVRSHHKESYRGSNVMQAAVSTYPSGKTFAVPRIALRQLRGADFR